MADENTKKSFVVYMDWEEALSFFSDAEVGEIFRALFQYTKNGVVPEFSHHSLNAVFSFMRSALDRDLIAYEKRCQKNRENGAKGGRPKKPIETEENPQKPNGFSEKPKKPDNDNDNDNDNENESDNDILSDSPSPKSKKPVKHKHGEFQKVLLTDKEYQKLIDEYGEIATAKAITFLDEYIEEKGYKSKSHYLAIKRWVINAVQEKEKKPAVNNATRPKNSTDDFMSQLQQMYNEEC